MLTNVEVWRAFRSSNASLLEEAGTFGWRIRAWTNKVLFQGYGPVDGLTAPLLLVTILARH
jgi:hypothetical protein